MARHLKPKPTQQPGRGDVARVDFGGDPVNLRMPVPGGVQDSPKGFVGQSLAPMIGMQDVSQFGNAPKTGLANHPALMLDDKFNAGGRVRPNHVVQHLLRLRALGMGGMAPVSHGLNVAKHPVQGIQIVLSRRAQAQPVGSDHVATRVAWLPRSR